jgi:hypothetical protein
MADAGLFFKRAKMLTVWQEGDERGLDACVEGLEPKEGETVLMKKFASAFLGRLWLVNGDGGGYFSHLWG